MDPRGSVDEIYKEDLYTLLQTKYGSSGSCGFGEEDFLCFFSHCKSMGANDTRGNAIFEPRGMVVRNYKRGHNILLHTKYESSEPYGLAEEVYVFPMTPLGRCLYGPHGHGWHDFFYKEDLCTLLHTK